MIAMADIQKLKSVIDTIHLLIEIGDGNINKNTALQEYMRKREIQAFLKDLHHYAISPYRDGFCTKVADDTKPGKRRLITAKTELELYKKLFEWYGGSHIDNLTVNDMYLKWLEHRRAIGTEDNTIVRDEQHYKRYYESTEFFKRKLTGIKRVDLKEFCCKVIRGETTRHYGRVPAVIQPLTNKEWGSIKNILNGIWDLAVELEYLPTNPLRGMQFPKNLFRIPEKKTKEVQVYNSDEQQALIKWCMEKYQETEDTAYLIPPFSFEVGTRVGETCSLQWKDIDGRHLTIQRSEFKDRRTGEVTVQGHTKTYHDRTVPVSMRAIGILDILRKRDDHDSSDWVFHRDGERITGRQANYVLEKYAKDTGCIVKSSHKLRKTCGSNLHAKGFTPKQCADYLGNTPEVFLRNYCFDTSTDEELFALLDA